MLAFGGGLRSLNTSSYSCFLTTVFSSQTVPVEVSSAIAQQLVIYYILASREFPFNPLCKTAVPLILRFVYYFTRY